MQYELVFQIKTTKKVFYIYICIAKQKQNPLGEQHVQNGMRAHKLLEGYNALLKAVSALGEVFK